MTVHGGYSVDDPCNSDLSTAMRSRNSAAYLAVRHRFGAFQFGIEYLNWTTEYIDYGDGNANRYYAHLAYYF